MKNIKVFVLGRPGSGKSTAAEQLARTAWDRRLPVLLLDDYSILRKMFHQDVERQKFNPTEHDGFDVKDFSVLITALEEIKLQISKQEASPTPDNRCQLTIIEFARNGYRDALDLFDKRLLTRDAYFIFVDADLERCIERVCNRNRQLKTPDEHYVSEHILRTYYAEDDGGKLRPYLKKRGAAEKNIKLLENSGSEHEFLCEVKQTIDQIFDDIPAVAAAGQLVTASAQPANTSFSSQLLPVGI